MRTPLVVRCDRASLAAALQSGADALMLDLGDPGRPGERAALRAAAVEALASRPREAGCRPLVLVRVAPLSSSLVDADLDVVMAGGPDAIVLPGAVGAVDVQHLAAKLAVREAEHGLVARRTGIVPVAADTARGVLALPTIPGASPRLRALAWDRAALARDLGTGVASDPCRFGVASLLLTAAAAGVPSFEIARSDGGTRQGG